MKKQNPTMKIGMKKQNKHARGLKSVNASVLGANQ